MLLFSEAMRNVCIMDHVFKCIDGRTAGHRLKSPVLMPLSTGEVLWGGGYKAVISRMRCKQLARLKDLLSASGKTMDNGGFNVHSSQLSKVQSKLGRNIFWRRWQQSFQSSARHV